MAHMFPRSSTTRCTYDTDLLIDLYLQALAAVGWPSALDFWALGSLTAFRNLGAGFEGNGHEDLGIQDFCLEGSPCCLLWLAHG